MEKLKRMFENKRNYANDRRRLNRKLKKAGIDFEWHHLYDGYQWTFPGSIYPYGDAVIHFGSYGHSRGHFETMAIGPEDDCIERTAEELIELLVKHE